MRSLILPYTYSYRERERTRALLGGNELMSLLTDVNGICELMTENREQVDRLEKLCKLRITRRTS